MMKWGKYRCVYLWVCFVCLLVNFDMYRMYEWVYMIGYFCFFCNLVFMFVDLRFLLVFIFRFLNLIVNE